VFKTSSFCGIGIALEIEVGKDVVRLRHSQEWGIVITVSTDEWRAFINGVKAGEFDPTPV